MSENPFLLPWSAEGLEHREVFDRNDSYIAEVERFAPEGVGDYLVAAANLCNGDLARIAALLRLTEGIPTEEITTARAMVLSPFALGDVVIDTERGREGRTGTIITVNDACYTVSPGDFIGWIQRAWYLRPSPSLPAAGNEGGER